MSGHRAKTIKRAFFARYGRMPEKTRTLAGTVAGYPVEMKGSEWRRLKKHGLAA